MRRRVERPSCCRRFWRPTLPSLNMCMYVRGGLSPVSARAGLDIIFSHFIHLYAFRYRSRRARPVARVPAARAARLRSPSWRLAGPAHANMLNFFGACGRHKYRAMRGGQLDYPIQNVLPFQLQRDGHYNGWC